MFLCFHLDINSGILFVSLYHSRNVIITIYRVNIVLKAGAVFMEKWGKQNCIFIAYFCGVGYKKLERMAIKRQQGAP